MRQFGYRSSRLLEEASLDDGDVPPGREMTAGLVGEHGVRRDVPKLFTPCRD